MPDGVSALDEAAARWAVRVDAGTLSAEEEAELDRWTAADPRHAGAFARAMAANAYFERAAFLGATSMPQPEPPEPEQPQRILMSRRTWLGGGAGAIAASLLAVIGLRSWQGGERIQTTRGNIRRSALADGSAVTLNTAAAIDVAFKPQLRTVKLLAGEVNFDVAKDRARPFLVDAGPVRITVVGTSFIVRLLEAGMVAVTVREGIVDVSQGEAAPTRLVAGDRLTLGASGTPDHRRLSAADVDRLGLWQSGQIDLTDMTLADAAAEFARYSDQHIVIEDPAVARMKVAGIYSTSDPAGFAEAAAQSLDLKMSRSTDAILLSAAR
jgi:transmembrane sensor